MGKLSNIEWKNIYYMIRYCVDELKYFEDSEIDYDEIDSTRDLLAMLLCNSFEILYKNGYIKEYNSKQLITDKPRGKINIPKSISKGTIGKSQLVCDVTVLNIDSKLNRIIKSAFSAIMNLNSSKYDKIDSELYTKLYRYYDMLKLVGDIDLLEVKQLNKNEIPEWYRPVISVCELIYNNWLAYDKDGKHRLYCLTEQRRLCYIWQKYLLALAKHKLKHCKVNAETFVEERHTWKTDLTIRNKDRVLIADAKWYEESDMSTANINQVNAYESKYIEKYNGVITSGILLYAGNKTEYFKPVIMDHGKTVTEYTINVNQDVEIMEKEIVDILETYL